MNKTCGECKWFVLNSEGRCRSNEGEENANNDCCSFFEPKVITNGDVIRQSGDRDFAEYFVYETGAMFASTLIVDKTFDTYEETVKATEDYLNAPAESEVNNAGAQGIIIEDRGLYKMMAFEESYIDLKNPISIEQRNTSPAEDALKEALQDMCELWESIGEQIPPLLNEQKYLNARNLAGNAPMSLPNKVRETMEKSDKTCRSCNFYNNKHHICLLHPDVPEIRPDDFCVSSWEPRKKETNRVRLTGLTNQKIAELWSKQAFLFAWCYDCPEFCKDGSCAFDQERCEHRVNNWLDADFTEQMDKESEGEDERV